MNTKLLLCLSVFCITRLTGMVEVEEQLSTQKEVASRLRGARTTPPDSCPCCHVVYGGYSIVGRKRYCHSEATIQPCKHHLCWVCAYRLWDGSLPPCCPVCFDDMTTVIKLKDRKDMKALIEAHFTPEQRK